MAAKPRIALGGIIHETHSFAETPTSLEDFRKQSLYYGGEIIDAMDGTRSAIGGMITGARNHDWQIVPTVYDAAMPSGIVTAHAFRTMLDDMLRQVEDALPLDGVLLALHGAMVTEDTLDAESVILSGVRQIVGESVPIVVELDMHGNISQQTAQLADVLVAFDTNPHIDPYDRGVETADILAQLIKGESIPTVEYVSVPLVLAPQATGTSDFPLKAVHERARQMEQDPNIICICVMAGFAYADTPFTGASIIVTANNQPKRARQYADELASIMLQHSDKAMLNYLSPDAAVKQAMGAEGGPVILVDSADNIGGGTPGDGTDILKAMLENEVNEGTVVLADVGAASACWYTGLHNQLTLEVGGKTDQWHGPPISVMGTVKGLSEGRFKCELPDNHFASFYGDTIDMGRTAWLRVGGVNVILTTYKTPPFDLAQLRGVGVIPEKQKMIAVKSAVAYRAAYLPIAHSIIEVDTRGLCSANLTRFPYKHIDKQRLGGNHGTT